MGDDFLSDPDFGLFIGSDGYGSIKWRRVDHSRESALTDEQVEQIAARFDFEVDEIYRLARSLAESLDPNCHVLVVPLSRQLAQTRGQSHFGKTLKTTRKAHQVTTAANEKSRARGFTIAGDARHRQIWREVQSAISRAQEALQAALEKLEVLDREGAAPVYYRPANSSRVPDRRRDAVLSSIGFFLSKSNRTLGFTTDTRTSERSGPLIEFVNAIVSCVTEPPSELSGNTIVAYFGKMRPWFDCVSGLLSAPDDPIVGDDYT